jgi:hypothetical protein
MRAVVIVSATDEKLTAADMSNMAPGGSPRQGHRSTNWE